MAWPGLNYATAKGRADPLPFNAAHFPEAPEEKGMMIYFLHGFSVFLGVLAGTAVTILTQLYFARRAQTQQTQNLKFELGTERGEDRYVAGRARKVSSCSEW